MAAKITKRERKSQKALERMLLGIPEHEQGANGRSDKLLWIDEGTTYHRYKGDSAHLGGSKKKGGRVKWER